MNVLNQALYSRFKHTDERFYTDQIGKGISSTHRILGGVVKKLYNVATPSFLRTTAARIVILSVPFFQMYDGFANLIWPVGGLILYKLTKKEIFSMSNNDRKCHFAWAKASFIGMFLLLPRLFVRPNLIIPPVGHNPSPKGSRTSIVTPLSPKYSVLSSYYTDPAFNIDHQALARKELNEKTTDELDKNWNLLKYFGNLRFINLKKDTEKCKQIVDHLNSLGIPEAEKYRFDAFFGQDLPAHWWQRIDSNYTFLIPILEQKKLDRQHQRELGCFFSHFAIIKEAKENHAKAIQKYESLKNQIEETNTLNKSLVLLQNKLEKAKENIKKFNSILILEDDNRFGKVLDPEKHIYSSEGVGKVFREAMVQLPKEFDMFFLMALDLNHFRGNYNPVLPQQRVKPLWMGYDLNAYVVHARFYDTILSNLEKIITDTECLINPIDVEIAKLMVDSKVYRATPDLAFQGGFKSEIIQSDKVRPLVQRNNREWKYLEQEKGAVKSDKKKIDGNSILRITERNKRTAQTKTLKHHRAQ